LKKKKATQKTSELKQIQITAKSAKNDLETRVKRINEFLEEENKVEIMLVLKGREKYNREWARYKLNEFLKMIAVEYKTTMEPRFIGKGMVMQIMKK
jgi:translation initiation factor IF-3